jgi:hypothetical protein
MTLEQWMNAIKYRITEGSEYTWRCYGDHAYTLGSWSGCNDTGYSADIVFDTKTQTVYEFSIIDYRTEEHFRWINPDYTAAYKTESANRGIRADDSCTGNPVVDVGHEQDLLGYYDTVINQGVEYEDQSRRRVEIDIDDETFLKIARMAHERDITFNQMCEVAIRAELDRVRTLGENNESSC